MAWLAIILEYGIPAAYKLWKEWSTKTDPTEEDWAKLMALSEKTAQWYKDNAPK